MGASNRNRWADHPGIRSIEKERPVLLNVGFSTEPEQTPLLVSSIDGLQDHVQKGAKAVKPGSDVERWQQAIEQVTAIGPADATFQAQSTTHSEDVYAAAWSDMLRSL